MLKIIEKDLFGESLEETRRFVERKLRKRNYKKFILNFSTTLNFEDDKKLEVLELEPVLIENQNGGKVIAAIHINTTGKDKPNIKDIYIPITNSKDISMPLNYILNAGLKYSSLRGISKSLKEFGYEKVKYTYRDEIIEF